MLPLFQEVVLSGGVIGSAMTLELFTDHLAIPIIHHLGIPFGALICGLIAFVVIFLLLTYYLAPIRSS